MNHINMIIQAVIYVSKEPITGYDITKIIQAKSGNKHQQVYRELAKLAKRDDMNVESIPQEGKPDKKIYSFKKENNFSFITNHKSDFTKTDVGYALLLNDFIYGTDIYDDYVDLMSDTEMNFLEKNAQKIKIESLKRNLVNAKG